MVPTIYLPERRHHGVFKVGPAAAFPDARIGMCSEVPGGDHEAEGPSPVITARDFRAHSNPSVGDHEAEGPSPVTGGKPPIRPSRMRRFYPANTRGGDIARDRESTPLNSSHP